MVVVIGCAGKGIFDRQCPHVAAGNLADSRCSVRGKSGLEPDGPQVDPKPDRIRALWARRGSPVSLRVLPAPVVQEGTGGRPFCLTLKLLPLE